MDCGVAPGPGSGRGVCRPLRRADEVAVVPPRLFTAREYSEEMTRTGFNRTWREETSRTLHSTAAGVSRKNDGPLNFDLPFQLPKGLSSIFGEGAPNLRVSGSEQI